MRRKVSLVIAGQKTESCFQQKLLCANGSWGLPPARVGRCRAIYYSTVAQLVEQSAVNRSVAGSSPACGAIFLFERLCCRFSSVGRALPW